MYTFLMESSPLEKNIFYLLQEISHFAAVSMQLGAKFGQLFVLFFFRTHKGSVLQTFQRNVQKGNKSTEKYHNKKNRAAKHPVDVKVVQKGVFQAVWW